jgi:hypothetical protein
LNSIKVVQAFNQEETEIKNYEKYLVRAKHEGVKTHLKSAIVNSILTFGIFSFISYALYTGSLMTTENVVNSNSGNPYDSCEVLIILFGFMLGSFSL